MRRGVSSESTLFAIMFFFFFFFFFLFPTFTLLAANKSVQMEKNVIQNLRVKRVKLVLFDKNLFPIS